MSSRAFADWIFESIGAVEPERNVAGDFSELMPQSRYVGEAKLHAHGAGPFCRFRIARQRRAAGLYVLAVEGDPVYAGECTDLEKRWGPNGYGGISPRNCFHGGQPTNCRINAAILAAAKEARKIELWFSPMDAEVATRRDAETKLIRSLRPPWNRAKMIGSW